MNLCKTLTHSYPIPVGTGWRRVKCPLVVSGHKYATESAISSMLSSRTMYFQRSKKCYRVITACINNGQEIMGQELEQPSSEKVEMIDIVTSLKVEGRDEENGVEIAEFEKEEFSSGESIWNQIVEIGKFSGPAVGLWICGPLMSLIDTAVIGQGSSTELAALGLIMRKQTLFCSLNLLHFSMFFFFSVNE